MRFVFVKKYKADNVMVKFINSFLEYKNQYEPLVCA